MPKIEAVTSADVEQIIIKDGRATGVALASGEKSQHLGFILSEKTARPGCRP